MTPVDRDANRPRRDPQSRPKRSVAGRFGRNADRNRSARWEADQSEGKQQGRRPGGRGERAAGCPDSSGTGNTARRRSFDRPGEGSGGRSRAGRGRAAGESGGFRQDRAGDQRRSPRGHRGERADRPRRFDPRGMRGEEARLIPPGLEPAENEPELPAGVDTSVLPRAVRAELRGLTKQLADRVGGHLAMAGLLVEEDPELALRHARVARRLASRLPVVREICAEVAYLGEDFEMALSEYRAIHRMSGSAEYLPIIADCERATGRRQAALRTIRQARQARLSGDQETELTLVEAGIRSDLGQLPEGLRLLKDAIQARRGGRAAQARYRYAYADLLVEAGQIVGAREWFASAANYDDQDALDARQRIAILDGQPLDEDTSDEMEILDVDEADDE